MLKMKPKVKKYLPIRAMLLLEAFGGGFTWGSALLRY